MHLPKATRRRITYAVATVVVCGSTVLTWQHFAGQGQPSARMTPSAVSVHPELQSDLAQSVTKDAPQKKGAAGTAAGATDKQQLQAREKVSTYKVVEGDTIGGIAERLGLKAESILMTNNLSDTDLISVGQELEIPAVDGMVYEVASGDNLWDIARTYGVSHEDIINANPDLNPDNIQIGQKLLLPGATAPLRNNQVASRGTPGRPTGRKLSWPTVGPLTDWFGWRIHPVYGTNNYHDGIDIGVGTGTPVGAAAGGTVIMAQRYGGYGLTVRVDHGNGVVTWYAHLSDIEVSVGQKVATGALIGYSGNTGTSTGPHLHFTVTVDGEPVDPMTWLP